LASKEGDDCQDENGDQPIPHYQCQIPIGTSRLAATVQLTYLTDKEVGQHGCNDGEYCSIARVLASHPLAYIETAANREHVQRSVEE
jgi:hypothetical protein